MHVELTEKVIAELNTQDVHSLTNHDVEDMIADLLWSDYDLEVSEEYLYKLYRQINTAFWNQY